MTTNNANSEPATLEQCRRAALVILGAGHGLTDETLTRRYVGCDLMDEVIPQMDYEASL